MIKTRLAFLIGPGMMAGTMIGVLINITFPAIFIVSVILIASAYQVYKICKKALILY